MMGYLDVDRQFMPFQDEESWEVQYQSFLSEDFYGYPPDLQDAAVQTVLQQAEVLLAA
ncbi:MAG: hypothetical protein QNK17_10110 [Hyphomicrobiaceae bacterium]|jgi:hypothetical protein|nr:hypothetical protein [Methyloceanibacter sp.]MDX2318729.1 hypothetical protein [Hyphomicrobiaceae bacterium]MDX2450762.1 hypothetical protein [Hyphomicrobiaceae bacterium]